MHKMKELVPRVVCSGSGRMAPLWGRVEQRQDLGSGRCLGAWALRGGVESLGHHGGTPDFIAQETVPMVSKIASRPCRQLERARFAGCIPAVSSGSGNRDGTLSSSRLAQITRVSNY